MRKSNAPLRPAETSLIIQSKIENLDPQRILARDELVREGVPLDLAQAFCEEFSDFQKNGIPYMKEKLRERGAPEWGIEVLSQRTLKAFGQVMAEEITGNI
jgi:hypothetical protein